MTETATAALGIAPKGPKTTVRTHPVVVAGILGTGVAVVANAAYDHDLFGALVYGAAVCGSAALVKSVFDRGHGNPPVVRVQGAAIELAVLLVSFALGLFWLYGRFAREQFPPPGFSRVVWFLALVGCVFNAVPAVFLLSRRYRLSDLGVRASGLRVVPVIVAIFAVVSVALAPGAGTWPALLKQTQGSAPRILSTMLLAAVPEEFLRFALQTRIGALLRNPAAGWFLATFAWAVLHGPKDWHDSKDLHTTIMGVVNIMPLGLLWGYITYRSGSVLPAMLLHATNLWGLQNLG